MALYLSTSSLVLEWYSLILIKTSLKRAFFSSNFQTPTNLTKSGHAIKMQLTHGEPRASIDINSLS